MIVHKLHKWQELNEVCVSSVEYVANRRGETPCKMMLRDIGDYEYSKKAKKYKEEWCEQILIYLVANFTDLRSKLAELMEEYDKETTKDFYEDQYITMYEGF